MLHDTGLRSLTFAGCEPPNSWNPTSQSWVPTSQAVSEATSQGDDYMSAAGHGHYVALHNGMHQVVGTENHFSVLPRVSHHLRT